MKIGKLVFINYSELKVKIASEIRGGSVNIAGDIYYFGNIGSYLKLNNAVGETIICEVITISDADLTYEKSSFDIESNRELSLKPIGTINTEKEFSLGVGIYPSLYSDVSIVTQEDMKTILQYEQNDAASEQGKTIHESFSLGISKNLINYPIEVSIDKFFNIHSAILGNSGSGKSNTIAHILQKIHEKEGYSATGSRMLIFDVNGEYEKAFANIKNKDLSVKFYKPNQKEKTTQADPFFLPHFLLSLDEWSSFLRATEAAQQPFWEEVLQESHRFYKIAASSEDETSKFINYFRYRICNLMDSVLTKADTATAVITTASGILGSLVRLINSNEKIKSKAHDLIADIEALKRVCTISYGVNDGELSKKLVTISKKIDQTQLSEVINSPKIESGEYFDYRFLKVSADLILLENEANGNGQIRAYTATMVTRLHQFLENTDCDFMRDCAVVNSKANFLKQLWGSESQKNHLVIIDTSELSPDILETVTSVISRLLFDERRRLPEAERREKPIHLVLDEAHRYIKKSGYYLIRDNIFEKIAREGRKYAYFLTISSQRPSELSETVLSQCGNFIIHRIQNEKDMHYIKAILPYFSDDFSNKIKQSLPGEALVFGNCVAMPLHLKIHEADPGPNSANCSISKEWFQAAIEVQKMKFKL